MFPIFVFHIIFIIKNTFYSEKEGVTPMSNKRGETAHVIAHDTHRSLLNRTAQVITVVEKQVTK